MIFFELPLCGTLIDPESVVAIQHRFPQGYAASDTEHPIPNGSVIGLSSGHAIETDEPRDSVVEMISKALKRANR